MRLLALVVLVLAAHLLPAAEPKPVDLQDADKLRVLKVQREQYRKFADREKARADYEAAQRALDGANAQMSALQSELRSSYFCGECELSEDLKLNPPLPKEVTVVPNR